MRRTLAKIKRRLLGQVTPSQLGLVYVVKGINERIPYEIPEGYFVRIFLEEDKNEIVKLMKMAGFHEWNLAMMQEELVLCLPRGFFVVVCERSNSIVAMFMARHNCNLNHIFSGRIDWLATHPDHYGKGLGFVVTACVMNRLIEVGYNRIFVTTDDHRLGAIKTFIRAGFVPRLFSQDMYARWEKISQNLGLEYRPEEWTEFGVGSGLTGHPLPSERLVPAR